MTIEICELNLFPIYLQKIRLYIFRGVQGGRPSGSARAKGFGHRGLHDEVREAQTRPISPRLKVQEE